MRISRVLVLMFCLLAAVASAQTNLAGKWSAVFTGPMSERPKMFTEALLNLKVTGKTIDGTAEMGDWPGVCQISEGTIEGDHFSFIATGELWSSSGYPRIKFDGRTEAGILKLTLTWGYVGQTAAGRTLPMEAKRLPVSK